MGSSDELVRCEEVKSEKVKNSGNDFDRRRGES